MSAIWMILGAAIAVSLLAWRLGKTSKLRAWKRLDRRKRRELKDGR